MTPRATFGQERIALRHENRNETAGTSSPNAGGANKSQVQERTTAVRPDSISPILTIENVTHEYGSVTALNGVSLEASQGEFLTVLGESGSGKTTLLRVISGLERPTHVDRIEIEGMDVAEVPAASRNCTTVFQNYALFPHMSVRENVEYGLSVRGIDREECRRRAENSLHLVRLSNMGNRRIAQLSGGEKQRVALARAMVTQPAILLLDEPLGALDEKLRQDMQEELVDLHRKLGMTFIYITHSQEEALTISDRIMLMRRGSIVQCGRPAEFFDRPNSRFAAEFMGFENIFPVVVKGVTDTTVTASLSDHMIRGVWASPGSPRIGQHAFAAIRAERLKIGGSTRGRRGRNEAGCMPGPRLYRGKYVDQSADTSFGKVRVRIWEQTLQSGQFDSVSWEIDDCVIISD